ncbi:MAG: hypothetical protein M3350_03275 [Actinomycetota bacterium]|nr:hypothetical protein [Actinomycetota bacterium]MDQ3719789.1 hypothetical protein [Actinomycetota bacterium]
MEWLLVLLVPVALLMLVVQLMPLAYLPDMLRRAQADFERMPPAARGLAFVSALSGIALGWVLRSGHGGRGLAYVLLGCLTVPIVLSLLVLPLLMVREELRRKHSFEQSRAAGPEH